MLIVAEPFSVGATEERVVNPTVWQLTNDMKLSTVLICTTMSSSLFQSIIVLGKKEFLYSMGLHLIGVDHLSVFDFNFSTMLSAL